MENKLSPNPDPSWRAPNEGEVVGHRMDDTGSYDQIIVNGEPKWFQINPAWLALEGSPIVGRIMGFPVYETAPPSENI